jgi:predicted PurR-regulated permease PerM
MREYFQSRGARLALIVVALLLVLFALRALAGPLTPFAAALALAYFLNPAVTAIEGFFGRSAWLSRRVPARTLAVGLLTAWPRLPTICACCALGSSRCTSG